MRNDLFATYFAQSQKASPALPVPTDGLLFYSTLQDLTKPDYLADGVVRAGVFASITSAAYTYDGIPCRAGFEQSTSKTLLWSYGLTLPNAPQEVTTFCIWNSIVAVPTTSNSDFQALAFRAENTLGQRVYMNSYVSSKRLALYNVDTNSFSYTVSYSQTWQANKWYSWAQTLDTSQNFRLFVNGTQKALRQNAGIVLTATTQLQTYRPPVGCALAYVCLYNRALSQAELLQMTNDLLPR